MCAGAVSLWLPCVLSTACQNKAEHEVIGTLFTVLRFRSASHRWEIWGVVRNAPRFKQHRSGRDGARLIVT